MTAPRCELVDVNTTRWYHCISRCVRLALLLGSGGFDRKQWIEDRLQLLAENFAISVGGFSVLDNHLHVLCRLDPERSKGWSAKEVVRRWIAVYPPSKLAMDDEAAVNKWVDREAQDLARVEVLRERLANLGWFNKALKEPLARLANKEDGVRGAFWAARYKSIAVLDEEALLATSAYVDLNPLAAGVASTPETSQHTSVNQRVEHVRKQGELARLAAAAEGSVAGSKAAGNLEQDHWLVPIEDRRAASNAQTQSSREGMLQSLSLGSYLLLVDYTARLFRDGKARMGSAVKEVFERLGVAEETWSKRMTELLSSRDLRGNFFAANQRQIQELAAQRGKRTTNLSPRAA